MAENEGIELVAFDLETTGLDPGGGCEILEVAGVRFGPDGEEIESFDELARPRTEIPPIIQEKTGILPEMVRDARPPEDVLRSFLDWAGPDSMLVVHNAPFDCNFVATTCRRAGLPEPQNLVVDTLDWARTVDLPVRGRTLETLARHFGVPMPESHRALADARAVAGVLQGLLRVTGTPLSALTLRAKTVGAMAALGQAEWLEPATSRQLDYLRSLGATQEQLKDITKRKASSLIDTLKNRP